jgi:hypothetical protein
MEIRRLGEVEPTFKSLFIPFPSVYPCGEKTPTMSGGSVMCIVDRTIIRNIWKLRMGLCSMQERASREGVRMPITQSGWATVTRESQNLTDLQRTRAMSAVSAR